MQGISFRRFVLIAIVIVGLTACNVNVPPSTEKPLFQKGTSGVITEMPVYLYGVDYYLHHFLRGMNAEIIQEGDHLRVLLPAAASFSKNSHVISHNTRMYAIQIAKALKRMPKTAAVIHGFSDAGGSKAKNKALSERRAHAFLAVIESKHVSAYRLLSHGHGEASPRSTNKTPEGRRLNRRVEITIYAISHQRNQAIWIYPLNKEFAFFEDIDRTYGKDRPGPVLPKIMRKTQNNIRTGCFWGLVPAQCDKSIQN